MSQITDPSRIKELAKRLKELRKRQGLSQQALSKKAEKARSRVSAQQIWRIESGKQETVRVLTVERLARALDVTPEILTGPAPLPEPGPTRPERPSGEDYSINVQVDGAVRNAFTLVQMRYRAPISRIVELAPLLFVLTAEASLERRKSIAKNLEEAFDHARDLLVSRPYHDLALSPPGFEAVDSEKRSISTRDIWGEALSGDPIEPNYDESRHNPFVVYLQEVAPANAGVASIHRSDRTSSEFDVCYEDTLKLTGGDEQLAKSIIEGEIILHTILAELRSDPSAEARVSLLRKKREEYQQWLRTLSSEDLGL
jgi:transcriptional regulator with XRE-family HTH domain